MRRLRFGLDGMVRFGSSRDGNSLAGFEELAMPLFDALYNFARWLGQDQDDAEDLVQETYLKALRGFGLFQPGSNFRAWIFQILENTSLIKLAPKTRAAHDRRNGPGRGFP
jgi:RNA polymerase sigma factor (sigma-70 family)